MFLAADHIGIAVHHIGMSGRVFLPAVIRSMMNTIKTANMTKMIGREISSWAVPWC